MIEYKLRYESYDLFIAQTYSSKISHNILKHNFHSSSKYFARNKYISKTFVSRIFKF